MSNDDPSISVAVGIIVGLLASFVQSLGLTIQRKSHIQNQARDEELRQPDYRRPLWLLGFTIFISSNLLGSIFQIAALPIVILAPLGAVSLLWNALFARILLGDVFSKFMIIGTLLITGGAIMIGYFGIIPEPTHSLDDLLRLFGRKSFIVYFSLLGFVVICVLVATHITEWRYHHHQRIMLVSPPSSPTSNSVHLPTLSSHHYQSSSPPLVSEHTPLMDAKYSRPPSSLADFILSPGSKTLTLVAVSYASISGLLSGMCLLFAKSGVELLVLTFVGGKNQFWRWEAWALAGGLVVFALLQLWYLHKSLKLEDPTLIAPLAFCFYNLSSILNGLIYFDQFDQLTPKQLGLVILGIIILLGGVWAVSIQENDVEGHMNLGLDGQLEEGMERLTNGHEDSYSLDDNDEDEERIIDLTPSTNPRNSISGRVTPPSPSPSRRELAGTGRRVVSSPATTTTAPSHHSRNHSHTFASPPASPSTSTVSPTSPKHHINSLPFRTQHRPRALTTGTQLTSPPPHHSSLPLRRTSLLEPGTSSGPSGSASVGLGVGGFSIGLSPASPGFALVPRRPNPRQISSSSLSGRAEGEEREGRDHVEEDSAGRHWRSLSGLVQRFMGRSSNKENGAGNNGNSGS